MRPLLLKGHERPLTYLKFNREGDLLISCAKDNHPTLWFVDDGERIGTYKGHNGTVWTCDISPDSTRLITGSGDQTAKLWDVQTGQDQFTFSLGQPCRAVAFSQGCRMALISTDFFMGNTPSINLVNVADDPEEQSEEVVRTFSHNGRISRVAWGRLNDFIISAGEDGVVRKWDTETGKLIQSSDAHTKMVMCMEMASDGSCFLTGSQDNLAMLWDPDTLEVVKTYKTDRPVNACSMSPLFDHIILGGGQDASQVTTTSSRAGKFETRFYHKIFAEEFATSRGHFGPINALAFSTDGRSFASGGEDGYVRLHHFDPEYFSTTYV